jgi:hypothetical protein
MNKPITSRVQHATDKGMVRQPLLNMGSPVKQKVKLENKAKEVNESVRGMENGKIGVRSTSTRVEPAKLVKGKENMKTVNTDTYDGSGGYASDKDWNAFLKTPKGKAYLEKNTKQVGTGTFAPDTYTPGKTSTVSSFGEYKTALSGDAKKPWHRRQDMRSTKLSTRGVIKTQDKIDKLNRKKNKLVAKYDTDKNGELDNKEKSKVKSKGFLGIGNDARSLSRTENRIKAYGGQLKGAQGSQNASVKQQEQSVRYGNKIDLGERDARLSDIGPAGGDKQTEILSNAKMKRSPYKMMPKSPIMKSFKK